MRTAGAVVCLRRRLERSSTTQPSRLSLATSHYPANISLAVAGHDVGDAGGQPWGGWGVSDGGVWAMVVVVDEPALDGGVAGGFAVPGSGVEQFSGEQSLVALDAH